MGWQMSKGDSMTAIARAQREKAMLFRRGERHSALSVIDGFFQTHQWPEEDKESIILALGLDQEPLMMTMLIGEPDTGPGSCEEPTAPTPELEHAGKAPRPARKRAQPTP